MRAPRLKNPEKLNAALANYFVLYKMNKVVVVDDTLMDGILCLTRTVGSMTRWL